MSKVARQIERAICIRRGRKNMSVPRWVLQTELGQYKTEKERESGGWARIKKV